MTTQEMQDVYRIIQEGLNHANLQDEFSQARNTHASWSNREEEWYFTNKRLLFSSKGMDISEQWVEKLNALVTPE